MSNQLERCSYCKTSTPNPCSKTGDEAEFETAKKCDLYQQKENMRQMERRSDDSFQRHKDHLLTNEGGPIHPSNQEIEIGSRTYAIQHTGMSLRDHFASQVLAGITVKGGKYTDLAKDAYLMADAMLKARKGDSDE